MSEYSSPSIRTPLGRVLAVLLLAASAAACDKCGDFVPPIRLQTDPQPMVCRDEAPQPR